MTETTSGTGPAPVRNFWGTPVDDVGEGYCPQCERAEPHHYNPCPLHPDNWKA